LYLDLSDPVDEKFWKVLSVDTVDNKIKMVRVRER